MSSQCLNKKKYMNRMLKVILLLIFLVLAANFFKPVIFPAVHAEEPYQVAVLKGRLKASMMDDISF